MMNTASLSQNQQNHPANPDIANLENFKNLYDHAADSIFTVDLQGVITYVNKAGGKLMQRPVKEILGKHFEQFVSKTDLDTAWKDFHEVLNHGSIVRGELSILTKNRKSVRVEYASSPVILNGKIRQIMAIVRDVSKIREQEKIQRELEKMQALQLFIAGAMQEIQYPLKALVDRQNLLLEQYRDRAFEYIGYKEFKGILNTLESMRNQTKHCFETTDRLLMMNRKKLGIAEHFCYPNKVIEKAIEMIRHPLEVSDIRLKLRLAADVPAIAIGETEFTQVLINILNNALESIPSNGAIEIKTIYRRSARSIQIEIKDSGIGIRKEVLPHIFEPFFTTKTRGLEKSSGLGLAIVYSLVQAHKGQITAESHYRKGTTIRLLFPVNKKS